MAQLAPPKKLYGGIGQPGRQKKLYGGIGCRLHGILLSILRGLTGLLAGGYSCFQAGGPFDLARHHLA